MSARKQRLELTWIGKDERPRLEPRILVEDADLSHHARLRTHSQKSTVAARAMADRKTVGHRS